MASLTVAQILLRHLWKLPETWSRLGKGEVCSTVLTVLVENKNIKYGEFQELESIQYTLDFFKTCIKKNVDIFLNSPFKIFVNLTAGF